MFINKDFFIIVNYLNSKGYFGVFIAGLMYTYGFTSGPATAIFLHLANGYNTIIAGLIGGLGALTGDLLIFNLIKFTFMDEINKLAKTKSIKKINHHTPDKIKTLMFPLIAGFIIASPLPDEIGVSILAISEKISERMFIAISYILNTAGILMILIIGNSL
jgi:uncharacterized membrane protein YdjX (TVP38/TMEM64 family)